MGNDGVKGNGKGWQIGEIALPGKGKEIGRYWCDEKVGYWAREEKEMCPGGATCLPLLGNVLSPLGQAACPKTGQKWCGEEGVRHHLANISSDKPQV